MIRKRFIFLFSFFFIFPLAAYASGNVYADQITEILGLPVTNSMLTSWIVTALIVILVRMAVRTPKLNPSRGQMFVEVAVEGLLNTVEPIVGKRMIRPTFWLLSSLFIFVLINNWIGLLPGVGTIGFNSTGTDGHVHFTPLFRPGNADLNMTAALAIISMSAWLYFVLRYAGIKTLIYDLFGNKVVKGEVPMPIYILMGVIFLAVGLIEVVSIAFRPISLSFRLFGNVFGGENLLVNMQDIFSYVLPIPFLFLETLVGLIQALVFMLLVSVYIGLICNHDSGEQHDH